MFEDLHPDQLIRESRVSEFLDNGTQTLRNDRCLGKGIPYVKIGRSVRYRVSDILDYIDRHRIDPELAS